MNRWSITFLFTLVLGGAWIWWSRPPAEALAPARPPQPAVDHPAPDFTLPTLDGETFTLSEHRGTPLVLNFWATWCTPCQRELPTLEGANTGYAGRVKFVGVDQGEAAATIQETVDELGLSFLIPLDEHGEVGSLYRVRGLPTTFFVDADGVIRHIWAGEMNAVTLAEGIGKIVP